jgi:ribosomal protein S18 acetylase RimI-like enzyme
VIRKASGGDVPFLRDMVRHAYYWRWGAPETADVPAARYVEGWGRPGDRGLIALDEGFPVGAAWYRLFTAERPGYGFLDAETPELTIAVVPSRRGRGLGEGLLSALLEHARADGFASISLSVEKDNPALHLYERFGFRQVREMGQTLVMRAELASDSGGPPAAS